MKKSIKIVLGALVVGFVINCMFGSKPAKAQYYLNNKCCTPYGWCYMPPAPVGTTCFCENIYGIAYGNVCL
jgi:hypothetical protein